MGRNVPRQDDSFLQTQTHCGRTPYGGSEPYDTREAKPFLTTAWAGYGFAKDDNEDRGPSYAQIDQMRTRRTTEISYSGACVNGPPGEFTQLIATETALEAAIAAIAESMGAGVPAASLAEARQLHRAARFRWDCIDAESSMGFHRPQEAVRVLGTSVDMRLRQR